MDEGYSVHLMKIISSEADLRRAFPVMAQLRPHLTEDTFVERAERQAREGGYLVAVLEVDGAVLGVAGFRLSETLFSGKLLYVDDLVMDKSARSKGYGRIMLDWLTDFAREEGCAMLELDSGVQRADAHRFYFREGMHIVSFRFRKAF